VACSKSPLGAHCLQVINPLGKENPMEPTNPKKNTHACRYCGKTLNSPTELREHERQHTEEEERGSFQASGERKSRRSSGKAATRALGG
jgi:hypothetical protein